MGLTLREARDLFEIQYLQAQLMRLGGNISRTAAFVGMERSALHRKLKQLGVTDRRTRITPRARCFVFAKKKQKLSFFNL